MFEFRPKITSKNRIRKHVRLGRNGIDHRAVGCWYRSTVQKACAKYEQIIRRKGIGLRTHSIPYYPSGTAITPQMTPGYFGVCFYPLNIAHSQIDF